MGARCFECFPSCTKSCFSVLSLVQKIVLRSCFLVLSLVPKSVLHIVLFGALLRAKNRAFWCSPSCIALPLCSRSYFFWCFPSCTKSWFLLLSLVPKIVLFGALPRAKNRALDCAFWCYPSCQNLSFLVLSFVPQIVLFGAFPRAKNRALDRARCYSY